MKNVIAIFNSTFNHGDYEDRYVYKILFSRRTKKFEYQFGKDPHKIEHQTLEEVVRKVIGLTWYYSLRLRRVHLKTSWFLDVNNFPSEFNRLTEIIQFRIIGRNKFNGPSQFEVYCDSSGVKFLNSEIDTPELEQDYKTRIHKWNSGDRFDLNYEVY